MQGIFHHIFCFSCEYGVLYGSASSSHTLWCDINYGVSVYVYQSGVYAPISVGANGTWILRAFSQQQR